MASYTVYGFQTDAFKVTPGGQLMLDPDFDASEDRIRYDITDTRDDANGDTDTNRFDGDAVNDESGDDINQSAVKYDAQGNVIGSGQVYLEESWTLTDGNGNVITLYKVEGGGFHSGWVADGPIIPGVAYAYSGPNNVDENNAPLYTDLHDPAEDPDNANDYDGGIYDDDLRTGAMNDTVDGGAGDDSIQGGDGADSLSGGDGSDTIDGGAGNDTILFGRGGDSVRGGDGDDVIDEEGGVPNYDYDDTIDAGAGNDTVYSGWGDDTVYGGSGNDLVYASDGNDTVDGGAGEDEIYADEGNDSILGGADDDVLVGGSGNDTLDGGTGSDSIYGQSDDDSVLGGGGDDWIDGGSGADFVDGGEGNDEIYGGTGENSLQGGAGLDTIHGGAAAETIEGGDDNDFLYGYGSNDVLRGDDGSDEVWGDEGNDTLDGGSGNDTLYGGADDDWMRGGTGNDSVFGDDGNDDLHGQDGDDTVDGGSGDDTVQGGAGADSLSGGDGADSVTGQSGNDSIDGGWGDDTLAGNADDDTVSGGHGNDQVFGQDGNDSLYGDEGDDTLDGGVGNDSLDGGDGNDRLDGGSGDDTLTGGWGDDTFVQSQGGSTLVTDFDTGDADGDGFYNDQLDVSELQNPDGRPINAFDVVVADDGFGNARLTFPEGETIVLQGVSPAQMSSAAQLNAAGIPCFTAGTLIGTAQGPIPVEALKPGDLVQTRDNGLRPIRWIGSRAVGGHELTINPVLRPVHIAPGTFGNARSLRLSPQHAIALEAPEQKSAAVLVRAGHLARMRGGSVRVAHGVQHVTYFHVLLESHDLIMADGVACESFYPGPWGLLSLGPAATRDLVRLMPELRGTSVAQSYGPTAHPVARFGALPETLQDLRTTA